MHAYVYIHSICIEPVMSKANQGNMGLFAGETYDFSYAIHFATVAFRGKKTVFPSIWPYLSYRMVNWWLKSMDHD